MTGHTLTIRGTDFGSTGCDLVAECSCGEYVVQNEVAVTLDRLAELMHAHIVESESSRTVDPVVNPRSVLPPEFYGDEPSPVEHTGPFPVTDGFGRIIGYWHG